MGFKKIFWGTIFLFDFRLNGFDVLPDIIGYILIIFGLTAIIQMHPKFNTARIIAIILAIPSIFTMYQNPNFNQTGFNDIGLGLVMSGIGVAILTMVFAYLLYSGISELAEQAGNYELMKRASMLWVLVIALNLGTISVFIIPVFAIPLLILAIITMIFELITLSMASQQFDQYH